MATIFPKKRLRSDEVIDIEDMNANIREPLREAESSLGEHNWKQNAFTGMGHKVILIRLLRLHMEKRKSLMVSSITVMLANALSGFIPF